MKIEKSMKKSISQPNLLKLIDSFRKDHTIFAPVKVGKSDFVFAQNPDSSEIVFRYPLTILPPKKVFLPPKELLMKRKKTGQIEELLPKASDRTLLFGVHLVDIHGILYLDKALEEPYIDEYYKHRRANTVVIGISDCRQNKYLAQTLAPDLQEGFDLYLEPISDSEYLAIVGSAIGQKLVESKFFKETQIHEGKVEPKRAIEKKDSDYLARVLEGTMDSKIWDELAKQCIACGICSYVCPVCYCTDTVDSLNLTDSSCQRCRNWGACMLPEFAKMAGFDPRPSLKERYRNWYYHKFVRWSKEYGVLGCVGCGRCVKYCPAGINYVEVLDKLESEYQGNKMSRISKMSITGNN